MKWIVNFLRRLFCGFLFLPLCILCLTINSGCTSIEQIRKASQETALNTKALVDIEGKKHPENKGVSEIIVALEKGLGGIPKPEPFQIPDWIEYAIYILLGSSVLQGTKNGGQIFSVIGKLLGNGKGKK